MLIEVELALDWYAPTAARVTPASGARVQFLGLWRELLAPILAQPTTWTLRDYHSPNLHWLPAARVVLVNASVVNRTNVLDDFWFAFE